jgi:hypothetical protein
MVVNRKGPESGFGTVRVRLVALCCHPLTVNHQPQSTKQARGGDNENEQILPPLEKEDDAALLPGRDTI